MKEEEKEEDRNRKSNILVQYKRVAVKVTMIYRAPPPLPLPKSKRKESPCFSQSPSFSWHIFILFFPFVWYPLAYHPSHHLFSRTSVTNGLSTWLDFPPCFCHHTTYTRPPPWVPTCLTSLFLTYLLETEEIPSKLLESILNWSEWGWG